jgi:hypothetical protein
MGDDVRRPVAIVDIDGVVADVRHRLHHLRSRPKRWDAFFAAAGDDPPHEEGVALVGELARDHDVVFLTGRPEHMRDVTAAWLAAHGMGGHPVVMRERDDRRPAAEVKLAVLRELVRHRPVAVVVDDDPAVLDALSAAGFTTRTADWEQRSGSDERTLRRAQEAEGRT